MSSRLYAGVTIVLDESKPTVGDVREWLRMVDKLKVSDDVVLDDCILALYLTGKTEFIECGDHRPPAEYYDVLVSMHEDDHE